MFLCVCNVLHFKTSKVSPCSMQYVIVILSYENTNYVLKCEMKWNNEKVNNTLL